MGEREGFCSVFAVRVLGFSCRKREKREDAAAAHIRGLMGVMRERERAADDGTISSPPHGAGGWHHDT